MAKQPLQLIDISAALPRKPSVCAPLFTWTVEESNGRYTIREEFLSHELLWGPVPSASLANAIIAERRGFVEQRIAELANMLLEGS